MRGGSKRAISTTIFTGSATQIEAVVERLDAKRSLFAKVEMHRKPGSIITSNTSGIPMRSLIQGRGPHFWKHFCGTHFFNPPRYLRLLELVPSAETSPDVLHFLESFGDLCLGKSTVVCKDTPGFISNRVGLYAIMLTLELMRKMKLTVVEIDRLTGPFVGRPKSATLRTVDVVGIDVMAEVAQGIYDNCPHDEERDVFKVPELIKE